MEKFELYYQNYETKNGTQKEFEKVTEDLNLWDIEPILGTLTEINDFVPKLIKTSGNHGAYYIHQCLVVIDQKNGFLLDFIYKTINNENIIYKIEGDNIICLYY